MCEFILNAGPGDQIDAVAGTVTVDGDTTNDGYGSANGGPSVAVNLGALVLFAGTQHLSALNILPGGTARMAASNSASGSVLMVSSLNVSPVVSGNES